MPALLRRALADQRIIFLIVGGINTVFGIGAYGLLLAAHPFFHAHYVLSLVLCQIACILFAFPMHRTFVFKSRSPHVLHELGKFASLYAVSFTVNLALLPLIVTQLHIAPFPAQLAYTLAMTVISYVWHNRVSFAGRRNAATKDQPA